MEATGILDQWRSASRSRQARSRLDRVLVRAASQDSLGAFAKLTHRVDGEPRIVSRPPLLVPVEDLAPGEPARVEHAMRAVLERYRGSLPDDRRGLLDRFQYVHLARKVVGVGSVGTRAWVLLLLDRDGGAPLILQFKEAQRSVLAPYADGSGYPNEGQRVVVGQRRMQAASDIFLGWVRAPGTDGQERDFYARQLWDGKISPAVERMSPTTLRIYGQMCGWTLARAHARSGDRLAIAAYLGTNTHFDAALAAFAETYADQTARDRAWLADAARTGRIVARPGI
jgi:uncharacterized protein (DUF2252 family)